METATIHISDPLGLLLLFSVIVVFGLLRWLPYWFAGKQQITAHEVSTARSHYLFIDVRSTNEFYLLGHIDAAQHTYLNDLLTWQQLPDKLQGKKLVLVCQTGLRAAIAGRHLRSLGAQCWILSGGIAAWQEEGLPLQYGE